MKNIGILISTALFLTANCVAEDYEFTHRQVVASSIDNTAPQLFLFNNRGELIHYSDRYLQNILSIFRKKEVLSNSEQLKNDLFALLDNKVVFSTHQFTLFYTTIEEEVGPCKPCRQQEHKIALLKQKIPKERLSVHSITIINEVYTVED